MTSWDSTKGAGDGISSEQWNNHVDDQKNRSINYVQDTAPSNPSDGDLWSKSTVFSYTNAETLPTSHTGEIYDVTATGDGTYYTGSGDATVKAVDISDGTELWSSAQNNGIESVEKFGGVIYCGVGRYNDSSWEFVALDATDGSQIWTDTSPSDDVKCISGTDTGVYTGDGTGKVVSYNKSDGSKQWEHTLHTDSAYSIAASNGVVVSGDASSKIVAVNASDGSKIWETSGEEIIYSLDKTGERVVYSQVNEIPTVTALDASDGSVIWKNDVSAGGVEGVNIYDNIVCVGDDSSTITALTLSRGNKIFSHTKHTASGGMRATTVANSKIISADEDENVIKTSLTSAPSLNYYHNGTWNQFN